MPVAKDEGTEIAIKFTQRLLTYCKHSHSSSLHSLNLIDIKDKTENHEFLCESKRNLQNTICDLYKRSADINIEGKFQQPHHFFPIKVFKGGCSRCEKIFTIRINQFRREDLLPGYSQFRRDIIGKRFTDHPTINHLNLLDYSRKMYDFVPHVLMKNHEYLIYPILLSYFENGIKNSHSRQLPFLLPKLVRVLKLLNMESGSTSCLNFYSHVVDSIREKHYDEPLLLLEIWKSLLISDHLIVRAFEKLTDHFPNRSKEKLRWVLVMASYLRFDLYGAWVRGNKLRNFSNCPVTSALLTGNYEQMKTLLDYGFLQNSRPLARYNVYLRYLARCDVRFCGPFEFTALGPNQIVREVLMFLIIKYKRRDDTLTTSMLDKCFHLLWTSIPHPMVTKQQLIEENNMLFLPYPSTQLIAHLKQEMTKVIESYNQMSFETGDVARPRSLCHLCRCSIRRLLTASGNLPHGVRQLLICKTLCEYLLVPEDSEFGLRLTLN